MALNTVIAAYDIRQDGRRASLAALLQAFGDRIQKSVFALTVTTEELDEIRRKAAERIDPDTDSLYFFAQCGSCWDRVELLGQAEAPERELFWSVM